MTAAEQDAKETSLPTPTSKNEPNPEEWLTDVIDQWKRNAFMRSLERRHAAVSYRVVVESTRLVRTSSS
jgi:hypothetical protein